MNRLTVQLLNISSAAGTASATAIKSSPNISTGNGSYKFDNARFGKNIVLVEGVRTPFTLSSTDYNDLMGYELQTRAIV